MEAQARAQSRLPLTHRARPAVAADQARQQPRWPHRDGQRRFEMDHRRGRARRRHALARAQRRDPDRSEEHTSELQSLMRISYAVFCLKKKTQYAKHIHTPPKSILRLTATT